MQICQINYGTHVNPRHQKQLWVICFRPLTPSCQSGVCVGKFWGGTINWAKCVCSARSFLWWCAFNSFYAFGTLGIIWASYFSRTFFCSLFRGVGFVYNWNFNCSVSICLTFLHCIFSNESSNCKAAIINCSVSSGSDGANTSIPVCWQNWRSGENNKSSEGPPRISFPYKRAGVYRYPPTLLFSPSKLDPRKPPTPPSAVTSIAMQW